MNLLKIKIEMMVFKELANHVLQFNPKNPMIKIHLDIKKELKSKLAHPEGVTVLNRMLSPVDTLNLIERDVHYMVSMRLHGNVFAAGIPNN
jgi:hypothetical protein